VSQTHSSRFSGRHFQLWEYSVSHGYALVRSPKTGDGRNLDIVFAGVEYLSVPRHLKELVIEEPLPEEVEVLRKLLGKEVQPKRITVLKTKSARFYVVSAGVKIVETDLDIFDNPF